MLQFGVAIAGLVYGIHFFPPLCVAEQFQTGSERSSALLVRKRK